MRGDAGRNFLQNVPPRTPLQKSISYILVSFACELVDGINPRVSRETQMGCRFTNLQACVPSARGSLACRGHAFSPAAKKRESRSVQLPTWRYCRKKRRKIADEKESGGETEEFVRTMAACPSFPCVQRARIFACGEKPGISQCAAPYVAILPQEAAEDSGRKKAVGLRICKPASHLPEFPLRKGLLIRPLRGHLLPQEKAIGIVRFPPTCRSCLFAFPSGGRGTMRRSTKWKSDGG